MNACICLHFTNRHEDVATVALLSECANVREISFNSTSRWEFVEYSTARRSNGFAGARFSVTAPGKKKRASAYKIKRSTVAAVSGDVEASFGVVAQTITLG